MKKPAIVFLLILGVFLSNVAWAGDPVPSLMTQWQTITQTFGEAMVEQGTKLLFLLAGLQFTIHGINYLRQGKELQELVMHMVWTLVTISFYFTIIIKSPTWFPLILDSWHAIGGSATKTGPLDPAAIMALGIDIVETIRSTVAAKAGASLVDFMRSFTIAFQVLFVEIFILLAFLVLAGQLALALLKGYLWLCIGPVLLGFAGLSYTKDVAMNTLKSAISIGATILTCYVIAGVAQSSVSIFNEQISSFEVDRWMGLWNTVGIAALLALASWQVPKLASDFINGTISGGVGETLATGAVAAAGAAALTGGVGGAMASAAKGATESLGGIVQAGAAGMSSAHDVGKTGMDAVGHAAKEVTSHSGGIVGGSLRNMLDTSSTNLRRGTESSFGGRVAQSIESSRGGSMSQAGNTGKDGGTSPSASGKQTSAPGAGGSSPGADGSSPGPGLGDASQASLSSGGEGSPMSNDKFDKLGQQLEQLASAMADGREVSTADKIRNLAGYVPSDQQSVGVNAQLGGGLHD